MNKKMVSSAEAFFREVKVWEKEKGNKVHP